MNNRSNGKSNNNRGKSTPKFSNSNKKESPFKKETPFKKDAPFKKENTNKKPFDSNKKWATKDKSAAKPVAPKNTNDIRLNKYIANTGVCSRREADIYIQSGNVRVNGEIITEMGKVIKITDEVYFDGSLLTPGKKEYVLLNKPKNFSTDEKEVGYRNVRELVKGTGNPNLQPVGRMDKNTTGLLLLTNDNDLIRKFSLPNQKSSKLYQVSLDKNLKFEDLEKIATGLFIDEHRVFVEEITYIENEPKSEIGLKMKTPNIKIIRNIFEHLGYDVLKIDRVTFAGLTKKNLPRGNWRFLTQQEIINLKNIN